MGKNIVICLDGTWNSPDSKDDQGVLTPTNVQKLFEHLVGSGPLSTDDSEKEINQENQVAKYIYGVGAKTNWLASNIEGATGAGVTARIIRGYTYVSRVYEPGDKIYIVGFSRGAYTARALADLIVNQGLLDWSKMGLVQGSEKSYNAGLNAWGIYKKKKNYGDSNILHAITEHITDIYDNISDVLHPSPALEFVNATVEAIGVWDTVGSLGIPDFKDNNGVTIRKDLFQFTNGQLNQNVLNGFHAIAIDEQRVDFTPTLWDQRIGITQVLFPGVHSDVGGGYDPAESGLSNCSLIWMVNKLAGVGIHFSSVPNVVANPSDIQHTPWLDSPYKVSIRQFPPNLKLSWRVIQQINEASVEVEGKDKPTRYRPRNLVNSYLNIDFSGPLPHVEVEH